MYLWVRAHECCCISRARVRTCSLFLSLTVLVVRCLFGWVGMCLLNACYASCPPCIVCTQVHPYQIDIDVKV